jgi:hypothetical protein
MHLSFEELFDLSSVLLISIGSEKVLLLGDRIGKDFCLE